MINCCCYGFVLHGLVFCPIYGVFVSIQRTLIVYSFSKFEFLALAKFSEMSTSGTIGIGRNVDDPSISDKARHSQHSEPDHL